jgi:hypothetical protein
MRIGKVTPDEAAATISMKGWAANDRVGWQVDARSVIIAAKEGSLDASLRSVFKRSTVSTMVHNV